MSQTVPEFIEKMGLVCEKEGMPRISGRMLGLLMVEGGPFSLDEIAERLQVSKASVSTNARTLEQFGMIERVSTPGDRRDFYRIESDPWEKMLLMAQQRWRDLIHIFAETKAALPEEQQDARERVCRARRFHELLVEGSGDLLSRWRKLCEQAPSRAEG